MKSGSRIHSLWCRCSDRSDLLWRAWRPYCWARGYHEPHHCDVYFEFCVVCSVGLWCARSMTDPRPNPLRGVDRVPTSWRLVARWWR